MLHKKKLAGPVAVLLALAAAIAARPGWTEPLDVYGRLPSLEEVALSPDGSRLAFVRNLDNERLLGVLSLAEHKVQGKLMRMGSVKLRSISWADDDHLLITTSATSLPMGLIGREQEWYMLNVYDIAKQKFRDEAHNVHRGRWPGDPGLPDPSPRQAPPKSAADRLTPRWSGRAGYGRLRLVDAGSG